MTHIPGDSADFESWPSGWRWETMKPYLEAFEEESCSVSEARDPNPIARAFGRRRRRPVLRAHAI